MLAAYEAKRRIIAEQTPGRDMRYMPELIQPECEPLDCSRSGE